MIDSRTDRGSRSVTSPRTTDWRLHKGVGRLAGIGAVEVDGTR